MTFQCLKEVETSPGYTATCNRPEGHGGNHRGIIRGPRFYWTEPFATEVESNEPRSNKGGERQ